MLMVIIGDFKGEKNGIPKQEAKLSLELRKRWLNNGGEINGN